MINPHFSPLHSIPYHSESVDRGSSRGRQTKTHQTCNDEPLKRQQSSEVVVVVVVVVVCLITTRRRRRATRRVTRTTHSLRLFLCLLGGALTKKTKKKKKTRHSFQDGRRQRESTRSCRHGSQPFCYTLVLSTLRSRSSFTWCFVGIWFPAPIDEPLLRYPIATIPPLPIVTSCWYEF